MGPPENPTSISKSKRPTGENGQCAGHEPAGVCSRDANSTFIRGMRASDIVARAAAQRRGSGRSGRPGRHTGRRRGPNGSGEGKAGATGSAAKAENHRRKKRFRKPRGSSLRNFFDGGCDRPGCYECFVRSRRSPRQRFCSHACRRAMERVWERERRWRRSRGEVHHLRGAWPRARQP